MRKALEQRKHPEMRAAAARHRRGTLTWCVEEGAPPCAARFRCARPPQALPSGHLLGAIEQAFYLRARSFKIVLVFG